MRNPAPRRSFAVVAGLLGLQTFIAFESFAVTTALPVVASDLGATQWYSLSFAATITSTLLGMTIGGNWCDRRGVRLPLLVGGIAFHAGIALCVLAPGMPTFILGRLLQGLGGGIDSVVIYVILAQFVPESRRPHVIGLMVAAWLLPAIVGPLLTGLLIQVMHWRAVFGAVLLGSALSLVGLLVVVRGAADARRNTPIVGRRGLWAVMAATGVLGLHIAGQRPPLELGIGATLTLVIVALAASRLLPVGTMRATPGIPRFVALRGLLAASVGATDVYLPLYLQQERGFSPAAAGSVVAIGAIGWAIGAWIQGRTTGGGALRYAAMLVLCGPSGAIAFIVGVAPIAVTVIGCVLMGVGMGIAYPRMTSAVLSLSPDDRQGANSSALQVSDALATSVALAVIGAVLTLTSGQGFLLTYLLIVALSLVAVRPAWLAARQAE